MRIMKRLSMVVVAVCAVGVMAATGAVAHEFTSSTATGLLLGKAVQTQVFTVNGGKTVECTALKAHGFVTTTKTLTQAVTVSYTGCKAFGLAATITTAKYLFNADGSAGLQGPITITAIGCTVTVPTAKNQHLLTIVFETDKVAPSLTELLILPAVKNITSSGTGAACTYAEESAGTYAGTALVIEDGGNIGWV